MLKQIFFIISPLYIANIECKVKKKQNKVKEEPIVFKILKAEKEKTKYEVTMTGKVKLPEIKKENKNSTRNFNIDVLRNQDQYYKEFNKKYDKRSNLDIKQKDIVDNYKINIRKELTLSENNNAFKKEGELISKIIEGINNGKLIPYSDINLSIKLKKDEFRKRQLRPVQVGGRRRRRGNTQKLFRNTDIDSIEFIGNIFWSKLYRDKIVDYLVVKISIPPEKSKVDNEITLCYLNFNDFVNFVNNEKIFVKINNLDFNIIEAINNDKLNILYTYIADNNKEYELPTGNYKENNFFANRLIYELNAKFFSNSFN